MIKCIIITVPVSAAVFIQLHGYLATGVQ